MDVFMNVREMIGHTPILKLGNLDSEYKADIYTKLELMNPAGSVKDRVGVYMLEDARKNGLLHEGGTIVLATAGNTGIGLALAALNQGYEVIFTVPEKFSIEKQQIMAALGAKIVHTPRSEGMLGAQRRAEEIMAEIPGAISINQFTNQANPLAHFETTGPEIYKQMDGKIDYFVAGAGSGGTFTGVMKYLRSQNPNVVGVLADPVGSIIGGDEHGDYDIEGIGNDFIADTMDITYVDKVIKVTDEESFDAVRRLARREGIIAGTSSGAALVAAEKLAREVDGGNIVTLFADRGDRYLSKVIFEIG